MSCCGLSLCVFCCEQSDKEILNMVGEDGEDGEDGDDGEDGGNGRGIQCGNNGCQTL
jgi:hypothetical protein